jgi:hypothetical protein
MRLHKWHPCKLDAGVFRAICRVDGPVPASNGQEKRVLCVHVSEGEGDVNESYESSGMWTVSVFGQRLRHLTRLVSRKPWTFLINHASSRSLVISSDFFGNEQT